MSIEENLSPAGSPTEAAQIPNVDAGNTEPKIDSHVSIFDLVRLNQVQKIFNVDESSMVIPELMIEELADRNLDVLVSNRRRRYGNFIDLFVAIQMGQDLCSDDATKDECMPVGANDLLVITHNVIPGTIDRLIHDLDSPNRRMLDIVYEELGIEPDIKPEVKEILDPATPLQGLLGVHGLIHEEIHRRRRASLRASLQVSSMGFLLCRAMVNEVERRYADGQRDTFVRVEHNTR